MAVPAMPPSTVPISGPRLKKLAFASSLLLAFLFAGLLLTWATHLPVWDRNVSALRARAASPVLILALAGISAWVAGTALLWLWARSLLAVELRAARREWLHAFSKQCKSAILHIHRRDALCARVCEIAIEAGRFRMAWIGMANYVTQSVQVISHAGGDEAFFRGFQASFTEGPLGRGAEGTALREGRPVFFNNVQSDSRFAPWREGLSRCGVRSAAGIPLRTDRGLAGCLVLYSQDPDFFLEDEFPLLEEIASDVSFALREMERTVPGRAMEDDRYQQKAELQMILDSVPAMVFYKDRQHRLVRANTAMIRTLGKPADQLIGKTDAELGTPYHAQYAQDEDEIAATGKPKLNRLEPLATTSGLRWLRTDKFPLRDTHGNVDGFIGLAVDVTEQKFAEDALQSSEADFRASFFSNAVGQVQADPATGRYLRVNPRFCEITGYSEDELLRMSFHELTHPDDRENDSMAHDRMVRGEIEELSREKRYRRKDGTAVWVNISASLIRDESGTPLRTLAVVRDITARHRSEEAMRAAEAKYRALVEQSLVGIYIIQGDCFVYANPTFCEITGYSAEELSGFPVLDLVHEEDRAGVRENIRLRLEGERDSIRYGIRLLRKDGGTAHVEVHGARAEYEGRPAILGTMLDMTERKRIEMQLLQSQKMEAIGQLAGGIAHDFNNILTAITGNTRLAQEDIPAEWPADHPVRDHLEEIHRAGVRAVDLVRRILTFGRQQPQERKVIPLRPVVEEALQLLRASIPAMIDIDATFLVEEPAVLADATQVHQVIMNLGTNARLAMGDHGTLSLRESIVDVDENLARSSPELRVGRYVRLTVSDSGCGMDRATVARIFDPFFTTRAQGEGTGLGLSVVHGIMKAHEGAVTVYSEPDKGTAFHLYFPVAEGEAHASTAPSEPSPHGHGERLLYVDDEEPLVYLATQVLSRLGYEVTGFTESEAALSAFLAEPDRFDVIITDLSMPRLSGREMAARILEIRPDLPIILVTGYIRPEDTESARNLGIRDLILKPNSVEELGHTLHRILAKRAGEHGAEAHS